MSLLKTAFTSAALLAGGLFAMTPDTADAQIRFQIGGNGYGYGSNGYGNYRNHDDHGRSGFRSSNYGGFGSRYGGYSDGHRHSDGHRYSGYRGSSNRVWHDTSHYDYHPTTIVPHGNHYHVLPGHYDFHETGHYDRVRGGRSGHGHSGHSH